MSDSDDWALEASSDGSDFAADAHKNTDDASPRTVPMAGSLL